MAHQWRFFRTGGLDQASLQTAADYACLDELDPKLWVALSCPVKGTEMDEKTLAMVDLDHDGRIRVPEVVAAAKWLVKQLKDPAEAISGKEALPLGAIDDRTPGGAALVAAGKQILNNLGTPDAASVTLENFADPKTLFPATKINGDGVLAPEAAPDDDTRSLIADIGACFGLVTGKTGSIGVSAEKVEAFFKELETYIDWSGTAAAPEIRPFGEATDAAYAAFAAVRAKVDDYFTRCRMVAFDPRSAAALNHPPEDYLPLAPQVLAANTAALAGFPLSLADAGKPLLLTEGINPAWAAAIAALRSATVTPAFGAEKTSLTEEEWIGLGAKLGPYQKWVADKPEGKVASLDLARAREIAAGKGRAGLTSMLTEDAQLGPGFEAQSDLERLIRYRRDLPTLLHNFVNFADFYSKDRWAVFQAGILYLDSRSCELCVRVEDPNAHVVIATMSKACLAYVECRRLGVTMKVACCFTQGDSDYLYVGHNGIFYDRQGNDWDATIVRLVDNPISMRQAFLGPYKKAIRAIEEQFAKRAQAADAAASGALGDTATQMANAGSAAAPPAAPVPPKKLDVGTVAAIGVAVGGISAALGTIFGTFVHLGYWMPAGLVGIVLVISGPAMAIAWLKLRQRTLGPLLEASGWAINSRVKINMPLGRALTDRAVIPPGSQRTLRDPYRDKAAFWRWFLFWVLFGALVGGLGTAAATRKWPFRRAATANPPAAASASSAPAKK